MSLPKDIQELQDKRSKLEDESHSLKEEEAKKQEHAKALEQRIIDELQTKNEETRQNISQLNSKIDDLEQRLSQIKQETPSAEPAEVSVEINQAALNDIVEEKTATSTIEDKSESQHKDSEEANQETEKKKRRFL
jgi:FtsZ-binding cell division protein ZapB